MNIEKRDIDTLTAEILVSLNPEDYKEKFEAELQKQSKNMKMKGFRKGKVSKITLKKMFGKSVLAEVVMNEVNAKLNDYLVTNEIRLLGSPIAGEDQEQFSFDPFELESFDFKFDVGLEPSFDVKGVGDGTAYPYYEVQVTQEMVDEEFLSHRKRMGEQKEMDEVGEGDRVYLQSVEMQEGKPKEGGYATEVVLLVDLIEDKKTQKALSKAKMGDKISFSPSKLEKDTSDNYVRKQILKIEDEGLEVGDDFEGEITKIIRVEPAEINEDFFKAFGPDIDSEEAAKDKLRNDIESFYKRQGEAIMFRNVQDALINMNDFEMPKGFLERWIKSQNPEAADRENFAQELEDFIKSLRWTLVKRKLQEESKAEVTHGEVLDHFVEQISQYMGGAMTDRAFLLQTAQQLMENQEQVSQAQERILDNKIFEYVAEKVDKDIKKIDKDELSSIIQDLNKK